MEAGRSSETHQYTVSHPRRPRLETPCRDIDENVTANFVLIHIGVKLRGRKWQKAGEDSIMRSFTKYC
jgi:hypothetical protein